MISPLAFRTAIRTAVLAALPTARQSAASVNWSGGAREMADLRVLLDVVSEVELYDRDDLHPTQAVESVLDTVVQIRAESTHDYADSDALSLLNDVRYGLRRTAVWEALQTAGVQLIGPAGATVNTSYRASQRLVSSHAFEITCRAAFGLATEDAAGLIEHVEYAGAIDAPADSDTVQIGPSQIDDPTPEP